MSPTATAARDYPRAECDSCQASVIWTITTNAVAMPVDYEPSDGANIALEWRAGKVMSRVVKTALAFGRTDLRTSHFATCPNAAQHRRKRTRS
jgi:hypothetical protein